MPGTDSPSPADARTRRAERLAVARALQAAPLAWAAIDACPAWVALPKAEQDLLAAHAGAWWLAASLRACIDGKRLQRVCDLLGEQRLTALRDAPLVARAEVLGHMPRPALPPADELAPHLLACGRALLAWSLPPAVRGPALRHLGWPATQGGDTSAFVTYADWAQRCIAAALGDSAPAPTAGALPDTPADDDEAMPPTVSLNARIDTIPT